jgi:hypothetical protein
MVLESNGYCTEEVAKFLRVHIELGQQVVFVEKSHAHEQQGVTLCQLHHLMTLMVLESNGYGVAE